MPVRAHAPPSRVVLPELGRVQAAEAQRLAPLPGDDLGLRRANLQTGEIGEGMRYVWSWCGLSLLIVTSALIQLSVAPRRLSFLSG